MSCGSCVTLYNRQTLHFYPAVYSEGAATLRASWVVVALTLLWALNPVWRQERILV